MSCKTHRNGILLQQSGEMGALRVWFLNRHLARCSDCRNYAQDCATLFESARQPQADADPAHVEKIIAYARREQGRSEEFRFRPSREPLLQQWKPAMIYAGLSVLLLAAFLVVIAPVFRTPHLLVEQKDVLTETTLAWDDGLDEELTQLSSMLATAASEWNNGDISEMEEIERLARELLEMEGMQI